MAKKKSKWYQFAEEANLVQYYRNRYSEYCNTCKKTNTEKKKFDDWLEYTMTKPSRDNVTRWEGTRTAPSLWEKISKDPVYESQIMSRVPIDRDGVITGGDLSLSNRKPGIMPKGYREKNKKPR